MLKILLDSKFANNEMHKLNKNIKTNVYFVEVIELRIQIGSKLA